MKKQLECFIKQEGSKWVAVCIDFNLVAQGSNTKEVKLKLIHMINSYVHEALTIDKDYKDQLFNRKASINLTLEYYLGVLLESLHIRSLNRFQTLSIKLDTTRVLTSDYLDY